MKNTIKKFVIYVLTCILIIQCHIQVYASEWSNAKEIANTIASNSEEQARITGIPRGRLISSVELQLTDKGRGTAGVYADLLCHKPMKSLLVWIYLEKWDEAIEDWVTEDYQHFSWSEKDYPNDELTMAVVGYDVSGLERGKYYRLRGMFGARELDSDYQESWQTTSGDLYFE